MELKLSSTMHSGLTSALAFTQELRPCVWRKTSSHKLQSLTNMPLTTRGRKRVALVVFSGLLPEPTARKDVVRSWHRTETESGVCVAQRYRRCGRIYQINVSYSKRQQNTRSYLYSTGSTV